MKISALAARGARRDFVDFYAAAQAYGFRHLLDLFHRKFKPASYSAVHLLKSLTYFEEAEKEPMPDVLAPYSWDDVKRFFVREAARLL